MSCICDLVVRMTIYGNGGNHFDIDIPCPDKDAGGRPHTIISTKIAELSNIIGPNKHGFIRHGSKYINGNSINAVHFYALYTGDYLDPIPFMGTERLETISDPFNFTFELDKVRALSNTEICSVDLRIEFTDATYCIIHVGSSSLERLRKDILEVDELLLNANPEELLFVHGILIRPDRIDNIRYTDIFDGRNNHIAKFTDFIKK